ncbi:uncharacterized protein Dmul_04100 [Desulfococcus multivorans]|nr:uncharacterized protein Dmul_04100 [Desulfococcus multivorans]
MRSDCNRNIPDNIRVLNAFRHRRSVRISRVMSLPAMPGAQRLSASEIGAGLRISRQESSFTGAQRLSASEIGAARGSAPSPTHIPVLNAFRHRRSVRPVGIMHQELVYKCSTPFGIGDRCGIDGLRT